MNKELEDKIKSTINIKPKDMRYRIKELDNMYKEGILLLNPDYQRNFVLSNSLASAYIESIFMGCVIPEIQLFQGRDGVYEVIDGKQRILSLLKFLNNEYRLSGLKELTYLNNFKYGDLPNSINNLFSDFQINANVMQSTEDPFYKYKVFERLNVGSKQLNKQELRNCCYRGSFNKRIRELSNDKLIKTLISYNNERFIVDEFILKMLSHTEYFKASTKWSSMSECVDKYMKEKYKIQDIEIEKIIDEFMSTIRVIYQVLGDKSFFVSENLNALLISLIYTSFSMFDKHDLINNADKIRIVIDKFKISDEFKIKDTPLPKRMEFQTQLLINEISVAIGTNLVEENRFFKKEDKFYLWNNKPHICEVCKQSILSIDQAEVDHIMPYSLGGKTTIDNAQLIHSFCNKTKSNTY